MHAYLQQFEIWLTQSTLSSFNKQASLAGTFPCLCSRKRRLLPAPCPCRSERLRGCHAHPCLRPRMLPTGVILNALPRARALLPVKAIRDAPSVSIPFAGSSSQRRPGPQRQRKRLAGPGRRPGHPSIARRSSTSAGRTTPANGRSCERLHSFQARCLANERTCSGSV